MTRRRGFTLIELLAVTPLLAVVILLSTSLTPALVTEAPALRRAAQADRLLGPLLQQVQRDIDNAKSLPDAAGGKSAGDRVLLIQTPQGIVCYEIAESTITRTILVLSSPADEAKTWPTPGVILSCKRLPVGGPADRLEVRTAITMRLGGKMVERLQKDYLFYLGALPPAQGRISK